MEKQIEELNKYELSDQEIYLIFEALTEKRRSMNQNGYECKEISRLINKLGNRIF